MNPHVLYTGQPMTHILVAFNYQGDTIGSCDSYGTVKFWDVRHVSPMMTVDVGPHPANRVAFDPSGNVKVKLLTHSCFVLSLEIENASF